MQKSKALKVLVVDDSSLMRSHICSALIDHGMITDTAVDGKHCIEKIERFDPDVITLDINMPVMDGMECLAIIMEKYPRPVVMVSSLTQKNADETLKALDMGAVDYVAKPHGPVSLTLGRSKYMLVSKIINASKLNVRARRAAISNAVKSNTLASTQANSVQRKLSLPSTNAFELVVIGVSTGGPTSLQEIIPKLPAQYPYPIVIAQHMPARFTAVFASRLNKLSAIKVEELTKTSKLVPGTAYIAQGDANIDVFKQAGTLHARPDTKESPHIWKPSITQLVDSALQHVPAKKLCCVQLTGMGNDGAESMAKAHKLGATTIAESEKTAVVYGMPKELVKFAGASMVLPNYDIAEALLALK